MACERAPHLVEFTFTPVAISGVSHHMSKRLTRLQAADVPWGPGMSTEPRLPRYDIPDVVGNLDAPPPFNLSTDELGSSDSHIHLRRHYCPYLAHAEGPIGTAQLMRGCNGNEDITATGYSPAPGESPKIWLMCLSLARMSIGGPAEERSLGLSSFLWGLHVYSTSAHTGHANRHLTYHNGAQFYPVFWVDITASVTCKLGKSGGRRLAYV